jgi:putative nucleotidyltransferase with HDIG domain
MQMNYIKARKSNLYLYQTVPLYYTANGERFGIYKPSGMNLKEMRVKEKLIPRELYLKKTDKAKGMRDVQKAFNKQLQEDINSNNLKNVKKTVVNIVDEMFSEPTSGVLEGLSNTVNIIVGEYTKDPEIITNFWRISDKDYTTALHSVNVMALAIRYAISRRYNKTRTKLLGLCALLHDVGKTRTDMDILTAPRKLNDEDFAKIKSHPIQGYNLLKRCKFSNPEVKQTALQHHEKLDGSGYPNGLTQVSDFAQIVSILDCFEALTNDDRPYRDSMIPFKALDLIQKDVSEGKFSKDVYAKFLYSLL